MHHHARGAREGRQLALGLGWFGIGLGIAELAAPRTLARFIGVPEDERSLSVLRAYGAREVATGVAILSQPDGAHWLWARVGGDMLDLATLTAAASDNRADGARLGTAAAAVVGVTALDVLCAGRLSGKGIGASRTGRGIRVEKVITINKPIEEVYAFWRDFENFPRFMRHLESVQHAGPKKSLWRATGPAGTSVGWEAEIVVEKENEWIAWRSLEGSDVQTSGSVRFQPAPGARGTEVRVQLQYTPPAGALGRAVAWLFGEEPRQQIEEDLPRFKQLLENGEITLSDGSGLRRPAQPAASAEQLKTLAGVQR